MLEAKLGVLRGLYIWYVCMSVTVAVCSTVTSR